MAPPRPGGDPSTIAAAAELLRNALRAVYAKRAGRTTNYQSHAMERLVAYAAYLGGFGTARYETAYFYWVFAALMIVVMIHDAKRLAFDPIPGAAPRATGGAALEGAS